MNTYINESQVNMHYKFQLFKPQYFVQVLYTTSKIKYIFIYHINKGHQKKIVKYYNTAQQSLTKLMTFHVNFMLL